MIGVWVNVLQELFSPVDAELGVCIFLVEAEVQHHVPEFFLVQDSITIYINALVHLNEVPEELLVLLQLKVEHTFEEDTELKLASLHGCLAAVHH